MQTILEKAKKGINMNLLAFQSPNQVYYLGSCPAGLGGYSNQEFALHFKVDNNNHFWVTDNLLEYLSAIITPWINLING
jgi:hypothetical protein